MKPLDRITFLVAPTAMGLLNMGLYYWYVVPKLTPGGAPVYAGLWAGYGATPVHALIGMMSHPARVLADSLTSGFFSTVLRAHFFLPLAGWRWILGIGPIVIVYGASDSEVLRGFGVYYAIILVPFLVVAASVGALVLTRIFMARTDRAQLNAAAVILFTALLVGGGYSVRPWKAEIAAVPHALSLLSKESTVLVQSGLYPHAGYEERIQLLTPDALRNLRYSGAAVLLAPALSAYPFSKGDVDALKKLPAIGPIAS